MTQPSSHVEAAGSSRFGALRSPHFRRWWAGYVVSVSGQQMLWVTEGWLIYELSGSKLLLAAHGLAQAVPATVLSLLGGAIADRVDQRRLLIVVQGLQMLIVAFLALLAFGQAMEAWHVIAGGFALSAVGAFEQPARQAMFPHLIDRRFMTQAVGLNAMVHPGTRVLSPVIAGFVLAQVLDATSSAMTAAGVIFALAGVGFVVYAVFLFLVHLPPVTRASSGSVLQNVGQGLRFTWRNRIFAFLIGMMYWNTFFALAMTILFPVVAKDILALGPSGLGLMFMAHGVGSLMGASWAASRGSVQGQGMYIVGGSVVLGVSVVLFAFSTWAPLSFLLLWFAGVGGSGYNVGIQSSLQLMVPDEFRGRVMGVWGMTHTSVRPLGEMQFGAVAALMGTSFALALGGVAVLAFVLLVALPRREVRALHVTA